MRSISRALVVGAFVIACGGGTTAAIVAPSAEPVVATTTVPVATTTTAPAPTYDGFDSSLLPDGMTLVAMAKADVDVYADSADVEPVTVLPHETILGTVTVMTIVEGPVEGWAKVMLPVRPNGSTGWVKVDDVNLFVVDGRIVVDISERQLTYYRGEEAVLTTTIAVGTSRNPTPTGTFFVTDNVTLSNPNSAWGPHALGLSARSDTITEYNGGDGIIGIHGTNRPGSIGKAASLGCIRMPNDVIAQIHDLIPIGTPVEIQA